jgi:hypothetical protein
MQSWGDVLCHRQASTVCEQVFAKLKTPEIVFANQKASAKSTPQYSGPEYDL